MDLISIGKKIKEARKSQGLSQEKLAELVGIHEKQISKIETGKSFPTRKNLQKIIDTLNVSTLIDVDTLADKNATPERIQILKIINSSTDEEIKLYTSIIKNINKHIKNYKH